MMLENLTRNFRNGVVGLALLASTACASVTGKPYGVYIIVAAEGEVSETISAEFDLGDNNQCKTTYRGAGSKKIKVGDGEKNVDLYTEVKVCKNDDNFTLILERPSNSDYWRTVEYHIPKIGAELKGDVKSHPDYKELKVNNKKLRE